MKCNGAQAWISEKKQAKPFCLVDAAVVVDVADQNQSVRNFQIGRNVFPNELFGARSLMAEPNKPSHHQPMLATKYHVLDNAIDHSQDLPQGVAAKEWEESFSDHLENSEANSAGQSTSVGKGFLDF